MLVVVLFKQQCVIHRTSDCNPSANFFGQKKLGDVKALRWASFQGTDIPVDKFQVAFAPATYTPEPAPDLKTKALAAISKYETTEYASVYL